MTASNSTFTVVDLFCGCGGLSRGMERSGRFRSILGVDINAAAVETFTKNHGTETDRPEALCKDIQELSDDDVWSALRRKGIRKPRQLDCLVGGPPCEGFSRNKVYTGEAGETVLPDRKEYSEEKYWKSAWKGTAGASRPERDIRAYHPFLDDPRNYLFRYFLNVAEELQPRIILIENVRQMLQHRDGAIAKEIVRRLKRLGYVAEARILNAAEYGVPQLRQRAFFVCVREDLFDGELPFPVVTHTSPSAEFLSGSTRLPGEKGFYVTVEEAIADLPASQPESVGNPRASASHYPKVPLSEFRRFVRSATQTPANHVHRTPSEAVIAKLRAMRPGMKAHQMPKELQVAKYYYNAYGRLEWNKPSNTITKSFIYPGSGKFGHPDEDRVISYREAARLQSFDDDFTFYAKSQEGISHMIGSAVPPLLGYKFAQSFIRLLDSVDAKRRRPSRSRTSRSEAGSAVE